MAAPTNGMFTHAVKMLTSSKNKNTFIATRRRRAKKQQKTNFYFKIYAKQ
jgi:hypothetical protein